MATFAADDVDAPAEPTRPVRRSAIVRRLRVLVRRRPLRRLLRFLLRTLLLPLLGPATALVGFHLYGLHVLDTGPILLNDEAGERLVVVGLLLTTTAFWTRWSLRFRRRRLLRRASELVGDLRRKPTEEASRALSDLGRGTDAADLTRSVAALADGYRHVLTQLVRMDVSPRFSATASGGTPLGTRVNPPTFPFERSRRQMVARLTPNLRWQSATPLLQKFVGRTMDRLTGRAFLRFVHPDDRPQVEAALMESMKEGEGHNIVFRMLPPASSDAEDSRVNPPMVRCIQADVVAYYDAKGRPEQLRCHFVDVTERVQAEHALRRRTAELVQANERLQTINRDLERLKESYRDLYHHAPVMYFSLDEQGGFAALNETMLLELGHQREEMLGRSYESILSPAARHAYHADPLMLRRSGEIETQWVCKDGRVRDVWIGTSVIHENGQVVRARCAAADITERNQLALAVVGRARDLEQANTELRRINQELEEFTYVVSHDLKEPLRTIEAFSGFLAADYSARLDEDGREYITHLIAAAGRLGRLIDDLLTLSRAGRVIGAPRMLDWDAVVETVLADLQMLVVRRPGCAIRVETPLPPVQGDPERITQLMTNLVGNALKYNESAAPEVVIGSTPDDGPFATLFVRDNGVGIDPRHHEQIFRIFRRLHRRDEYEGTGAGLAICKKVVEAHGGRIWVESVPGGGSTFFFTLPRSPARIQDVDRGSAAPVDR